MKKLVERFSVRVGGTILILLVLSVTVGWIVIQPHKADCTHGESSVAVRMVHGKVVTIQAAHMTGC